MAITTTLTVYDAADSNANWSELSGHTSGAAPASTTENFWQNGIAVDQATGQGVNQTAGMECDAGAVTWTPSSNWVFLVWTKFDAGTNLFPWASGGYRIGIGSSSGNMNYYNAMGDDFGSYPSGGWQSTAIDPEYPTPDQTDGTPVAGTYSIVGFLPNMRAKITKGSPNVADIIRYGRGDLIVTGTENFASIAAADNADTVRYGLFYPSGGSYLWKGLLSLGTSGTPVAITDANRNIRVEDTPRVLAGFNKIEVLNSSSTISWTAIGFQGVQTSITGSAPISPGDLEIIDNATVSIDSCTFTDMGTFVFLSNSSILDSIFRRCGTVTQNGAKITGTLFSNADTSTAVIANTLTETNFKDNTFVSPGTGYAVDIGDIDVTSGDVTVQWFNDATGYGANQTTNAVIRVNVVDPTATGNRVIINVNTGYTTPTVNNVGAGGASQVLIQEGQVTLTLTDLPNGVEVRFRQGTFTLQHTQNVVGNSVSYTYTGTPKVTITAGGVGDDGTAYDRRILRDFTLPSTSQSLPFELTPSSSYE